MPEFSQTNLSHLALCPEPMAAALSSAGTDTPAALLLDETGVVQAFDAEAERLFHCRAGDAVGQSILSLLPAFPASLLQPASATTVAGKAESAPASRTLRLDACPKDGSRVSMELTLTGVRLGTQRGWVGTLCDLSRRAAPEEALRRSEERSRGLFERSPIGLFQASPDGRYLQVNSELARICGYAAPEALLVHQIGAASDLYVVPGRRAEFQRRLEENGSITEFESQIQRRDGSIVWISESARAVCSADGLLLHYEGTIQDISARKQAERAQSESAQQLRMIFDAAAVGIARVDMAGRLTRSNPAFQKMLGYTEAELEGIAFARLTHPDDSSANVQCQWDLQEGLRDEYQVEKRYSCADGSSLWADVTVSLVRDSEGRPQFSIAVVEDITERRLAQQRILALNEHLERRVQRIAALHRIDLAIMSSPDMDCTLPLLLEQARTQLGVDAAAVLLYDPALDTLNYTVGSGLRQPVTSRAPLPVSFGYAGQAIRERRVVEALNIAWNPEAFAHDPVLAAEGFVAYWAVPLIAKGEIRGVLQIFSRAVLAPDDEWHECLDVLAGQAAIAIDSAALFGDAQQAHAELMGAYDATIEGWGRALDLRDQETEGHSRRVTDLAERLARRLGVDEEQIVQVRRGALLHDIGKMGVPDRILLKTDNLSPTEWRVMRRHPQDAYDMLSPIAFLRPALDIPYCHHEKWDGTGYPQGLAGDTIPLAARLFAVVDVWDALRSDRPYRTAWSEAQTLAHLRALSGTHFDPMIVDAFLEMITGRRDVLPAPAQENDLLPLGDLLPLC